MGRLRWWVHYLGYVAAGEALLAVGAYLIGFPGKPYPGAGFALIAAVALITSTALHVIYRKRNTNGRHRKAPEAHRAGAGGGAGDGTRAGRGARGRAGAGMSGGGLFGPSNPNYYSRAAEEVRRRALLGSTTNVKASVPQVSKPSVRPAGEFDGQTREFAAGVVTGTRSFNVDKLGRLIGVAYPAVWTPGENVAKCLLRTDQFAVHLMFGPTGAVTSPSSRTVDAQRPPHSLAECAHGFYGYYEGSNDYYEPGRVMAVVEAYGETVIGTRGFRASKARIVALHVPADLRTGAARLLARNYPEVPFFDSFDAMVAEFPPDDAGHGLGPDSDPDFWTRDA